MEGACITKARIKVFKGVEYNRKQGGVSIRDLCPS